MCTKLVLFTRFNSDVGSVLDKVWTDVYDRRLRNMDGAVVRSTIFDANITGYLILKIGDIYLLWKGKQVC